MKLPDGFRAAGTAIPVFSLRSADGFGVGEFNDIKLLVDWAVKTGQKIIQILPVNDTTSTHTWEDSYPYNSISCFALHPQFIHLPDAGLRETEEYISQRDELNSLSEEDYERVNSLKETYLRKLYSRNGTRTLRSASYAAFYEKNAFWLDEYARFCAERDSSDPLFYCFVQYHLDKQLSAVVRYARSKGVMLKGDLPIGVCRYGVDAQSHPGLFNMDSQCGAPPDAFATDGQNWGFPTYNWEEMSKDGYAWWRARLKKMSEYFDAFRIDHILGFFRIWEIPVPEKSGLMGHFAPAMPYSAGEIAARGLPLDGLFLEDPHSKGLYHPKIASQFTEPYRRLEQWQKDAYNSLYDDFFYHRHNSFWKERALEKLPSLLGATGMIACGEDLGMVPDCVPEVMERLNILSLEIQRMPKNPFLTFGDPSTYPVNCVCTTSTHDMSSIRAWWEEDRDMSQRYYNEILHCDGQAPYFCEPWVCSKIVEQHLASPARFTILPLQDWLAMDGNLRRQMPQEERINVPAIPRYYWRYRMHITLENLLSQESFNARIADMIQNSNR